MGAARPLALCALLLAAAPAGATLPEGDGAAQPFEATCTLSQTCRIDGGCADLPAPGEQLLRFDGVTTFLGASEDGLRPVDRYVRIEDAHPLPRLTERRRSLLVDLPPEGAARRFALFVQRRVAESADPVLQPVYFVLTCWDAP